MSKFPAVLLLCCAWCASFAQSDDQRPSASVSEQACRQLARNAVGQDKVFLMMLAAGRSIQMRIAAEDGHEFAASTDRRSDRINVRIEKQKVVAAECG